MFLLNSVERTPLDLRAVVFFRAGLAAGFDEGLAGLLVLELVAGAAAACLVAFFRGEPPPDAIELTGPEPEAMAAVARTWD